MTSCAGLKTIIVKVFIPGADKETHRGFVIVLVAQVIATVRYQVFGYN